MKISDAIQVFNTDYKEISFVSINSLAGYTKLGMAKQFQGYGDKPTDKGILV